MKSSKQTICLSMIVKNEAHVIERCLATVRPIIDHWVIVDTGSTDGTQDIIRAAMADMPGSLVERPWVDFAHNRSEALRLAQPRAQYSLIIDADDELVVPAGFTMPKLDAPAYEFTILDKFTRYPRIQLVNNSYPWRYLGVVHEFLNCPGIDRCGALPLAMRRGEDGARHLDTETYARDAALLENALKTEKDPFLIARYTFYLAQSYRDIEDFDNSLIYYMKRADLGFWDEEVYISLLSAAYIMEAKQEPIARILAVYDRAIAVRPNRAEARHGASRCCRRRRRYVDGFHYAEAGLPSQMANDGLFIQAWIYQYGLQDEHAANAFNTGQYRTCLKSCLDILAKPDIPQEIRARIALLAREAFGKMVYPIWALPKHPTRRGSHRPGSLDRQRMRTSGWATKRGNPRWDRRAIHGRWPRYVVRFNGLGACGTGNAAAVPHVGLGPAYPGFSSPERSAYAKTGRRNVYQLLFRNFPLCMSFVSTFIAWISTWNIFGYLTEANMMDQIL